MSLCISENPLWKFYIHCTKQSHYFSEVMASKKNQQPNYTYILGHIHIPSSLVRAQIELRYQSTKSILKILQIIKVINVKINKETSPPVSHCRMSGTAQKYKNFFFKVEFVTEIQYKFEYYIFHFYLPCFLNNNKYNAVVISSLCRGTCILQTVIHLFSFNMKHENLVSKPKLPF